MRQLHDLFDPSELDIIKNAPQFMGTRHPTWFPLHAEKLRTADYLTHKSVARIGRQPKGADWLRDQKTRLLDLKEINNASASLTEIRAYGALLEAGFAATPIPRANVSTPDFKIDAGDGEIVVEVFSKHQDKEEDDLLNAIHSPSSPLPESVERTTRPVGRGSVTITKTILTPGGRPDPAKPNDSVQANVISRVCAIKPDEKQLPVGQPALLIIDFTNFGGPATAEFFTAHETSPLLSGHHGITSGPIWYAMYGWKDAPIFQENTRKVRMGHDGRFRLSGNRMSKLSAVLAVFAQGAVLLENPWAVERLRAKARLALSRYPWFNLSRSIADWNEGDAKEQIAIHRRTIEFMDRALDDEL